MIKIVPDKEGRLTQWDLNRKVIVTGYEGVAEVHFASPGDDHGAYVVELIDGEAKIPNILLTMAGTINVYVYPADRTVFATTLWVMAREKPDDYIYTETEVLSYKTLDEKIGDLANLTTTARENLVAAINEAATKGMASIYMRVEDGYIEYSGDGVNWKQLIAVAELKGDKGDPGDSTLGITGATVGQYPQIAEVDESGVPTKFKAADVTGGTDISLGLTGAAVGDIIKVKAVDADGKPTEWEAANSAVEIANGVDVSAVSSFVYSIDLAGNAIKSNHLKVVLSAPNVTKKERWLHIDINDLRLEVYCYFCDFWVCDIKILKDFIHITLGKGGFSANAKSNYSAAGYNKIENTYVIATTTDYTGLEKTIACKYNHGINDPAWGDSAKLWVWGE